MSTAARNKIIALLAVLSLTTSCNKELDFGLYDELPTLSGDYIAPFLNTKVTLVDLVDSVDQLITDSTDLLKIYYRMDSVFTQNLDGLISIPPQSEQTKTLDYSGVTPDDVITQRNIVFSEILPNIDTATADSLTARDGTIAYFPPIMSQSGGAYPVPPQTDFNYVNLNDANLKLVVSNGLPVEFTNLALEVQNVSDGSVVANMSLTNLLPGTSDSVSVNLVNTRMESDLQVLITSMESPGSGNDPNNTATHVFIDLTDQIGLDIKLTDIDLDFGEVLIPNQTLAPDNQSIVLGLGNGVEAEEAHLKGGVFFYSVERALDAQIDLTLSIPALTDGGIPFNRTLSIPPGSVAYEDSIDLNGLVMDLTQSSAAMYNALDLSYQVSLPGTSTPVYISTSDEISFNYQMRNLEFSYREGYFGDFGLDFLKFSSPISNEYLDKINGSIILNDPRFKLIFHNSIGVPLGLDLDLNAFSSTNGSENLNINAFRVDQPDKTQVGQSVESVLDIQKTNYPSIVNFLGILPDSISGEVSLGLNPDGPDYDNFADDKGVLGMDMEIEIPLDFSASNFVLSNIQQFELGISDSETSPDQYIEGVKLFITMDNYFPLDADVDFILFDANNVIIDTIPFKVLEAATPNAQGRVTTPHNFKQEVDFTGDKLDNLLSAQTIQVDVKLGTFNNGASPVKIYVDYSVDVKVSAQANLNYKL